MRPWEHRKNTDASNKIPYEKDIIIFLLPCFVLTNLAGQQSGTNEHPLRLITSLSRKTGIAIGGWDQKLIGIHVQTLKLNQVI